MLIAHIKRNLSEMSRPEAWDLAEHAVVVAIGEATKLAKEYPNIPELQEIVKFLAPLDHKFDPFYSRQKIVDLYKGVSSTFPRGNAKKLVILKQAMDKLARGAGLPKFRPGEKVTWGEKVAAILHAIPKDAKADYDYVIQHGPEVHDIAVARHFDLKSPNRPELSANPLVKHQTWINGWTKFKEQVKQWGLAHGFTIVQDTSTHLTREDGYVTDGVFEMSWRDHPSIHLEMRCSPTSTRRRQEWQMRDFYLWALDGRNITGLDAAFEEAKKRIQDKSITTVIFARYGFLPRTQDDSYIKGQISFNVHKFFPLTWRMSALPREDFRFDSPGLFIEGEGSESILPSSLFGVHFLEVGRRYFEVLREYFQPGGAAVAQWSKGGYTSNARAYFRSAFATTNDVAFQWLPPVITDMHSEGRWTLTIQNHRGMSGHSVDDLIDELADLRLPKR